MKKPKGKKVYSAMKRREARNFYLYTAPWLIGFFVLTLYPDCIFFLSDVYRYEFNRGREVYWIREPEVCIYG